jgi:hypothetical protein
VVEIPEVDCSEMQSSEVESSEVWLSEVDSTRVRRSQRQLFHAPISTPVLCLETVYTVLTHSVIPLDLASIPLSSGSAD